MSKLKSLVEQLESLEATEKRLRLLREAQPQSELTIQYGADSDVIKIPGDCEPVVTEKIYLIIVESIEEKKQEIKDELYPTLPVTHG